MEKRPQDYSGNQEFVLRPISGDTPEERGRNLLSHLEDPSGFVEMVQTSRRQWEEHKRSGLPGLPPGWKAAGECIELEPPKP